MSYKETIEILIGHRMASIAVFAVTHDPVEVLDKINLEKIELADSISKAIGINKETFEMGD